MSRLSLSVACVFVALMFGAAAPALAELKCKEFPGRSRLCGNAGRAESVAFNRKGQYPVVAPGRPQAPKVRHEISAGTISNIR